MRLKLLIGILCCFLVIACNKNTNIDIPEMPVDSVQSRLPKSVRMYVELNGVSNNTSVYNFLYDTTGRKIQLYLDDTTTSSLYDQIDAEYQYDEQGYLVSFTQAIDYERRLQNSMIARHGDHTIKYITNVDWNQEFPDTLYFQYIPTAAGLRIDTWANKYDSFDGKPTGTEVKSFQYNADKQILYIKKNGNQNDFSFSSNLVSGYTEILPVGMKKEGSLSYAITSPVSARDSLLELFLGPDYYMPQLKPFYLFSFSGHYYADFIMSMTNPNQPVIMNETYYPYSGENSTAKKTLERSFDEYGRFLSITERNTIYSYGFTDEYKITFHFFY